MSITGTNPASNPLRLREIARSPGEQGVVTRWLDRNRGARAKLRIRVGHLRKFPRNEWNKKQFRAIKTGNGLFELKWECDKKEFRLGGFDDTDGYFILVLGFTHKDDVYDPANWLETAKRRMDEAKRGDWHKIDFEP